MDTNTKVCVTIGSFLASYLTFLALKRRTNFMKPSKHHWNYIRRSFMLFNAVVTFVLTKTDLLTLESINHPNRFRESFLICMILDNFAFDSLYLFLLMPDCKILIHHFLVFVWFPISLITDSGGLFITLGMVGAVLLDVFLHGKSLLRYVNQRYTIIYFLTEFSFSFNYYTTVLCAIPFVVTKYYILNEHSEWIWCFGIFGLSLQKFYFAWKYRKIVTEGIQEYYNLKERNEETPWLNPTKRAFTC